MNRPFTDIPPEYYTACTTGGTLTRIHYTSNTYDNNNRKIKKDALVYLPHDYDKTKGDYNIFYFMHGGGGNSDEVFGGLEARTALKNVVDNMIANGDIEPLIIVAPSFYYEGTTEALTSTKAAGALTQNFHHEFVKDLIPAIENNFRVKSGREHRAFGGFSMGSEATWNIFAKALRKIKYFLPMSGDCWAIELQGGLTKPKETVAFLKDSVKASLIPKDEYFVFACTGDEDIAYKPMNSMLNEMMLHPDFFEFGTDFSKGNFVYCLAAGGIHTYDYCYKYCYNALPYFFK